MLVDNATPSRWWIPPPGNDESLRSTLYRAAALYKCDPQRLWDSLNQNDPRPSGEIDKPSCAALHRMARALGTSAFNLRAHRESDSPWRVPAALRRSYCPHCWNEDINRDRPLMIRRSWNHLLRTRCPTHNFPLMYARSDWATKDRQGCYVPSLGQGAWDILDLIETFAIALEQSLFFGASWPQGWHETPQVARSILILVNSSMTVIKDFPPTNKVLPDGDFRSVLYGTRFRQKPLRRLSWDVFRSFPDPSERRAALWLTAWEFIPGLPWDLSPHGVTFRFPASGSENYRKCWPDLLNPRRTATSKTASRRRVKAIKTEESMADKQYTDGFKDLAIEQVTERGYPLADVTQRLGISSHTLRAWLRERRRSQQNA